MRGNPEEFHLERADSLAGALAMLGAKDSGYRVVAGGTDVMVLLEAGQLNHRKWLSINGISELKGIHSFPDRIEIGALTTYSEIRESSVIAQEFPMLVTAAADTGGLAIQNRGTLGGNIANASPAADTPPALLAYDAEVEVSSLRGKRRIRYADFHQGYKKIDLTADEILTSIRLPRVQRLHQFYKKVGTRRAQAISKVVMALCHNQSAGKLENVRVAVGSVAPTTVRCVNTEKLLEGQKLDRRIIGMAKDALLKDMAPIDDIRSTRAFRQKVAGNLLELHLSSLLGGS